VTWCARSCRGLSEGDADAARGAGCAVAAGCWAAAEPPLGRATGGYHRQARLIGGLVAPARSGWAAGLAIHIANGAAFGVAFDRLHPDVRSGAWPPLARNPHAAAQEVLGHAVFGAVLGGLVTAQPGTVPECP
jgi:hypothetical protein